MPLSTPADREMLHRRDITLHGYQRTDGLYDIEAHLVDTKGFGVPSHDRGWVAKGEPIHDMWLRLTVDETLTVVSCEAATENSPYAICPEAAPNFARLAGLKIGPGFNKAVAERVGGIVGCTHLRELMGQVATVAFQTLYPVRRRRELEADPAARPSMLGTCRAYAPDSPVVRRRWPQLAEVAPGDAALAGQDAG